MQQPPPDSSSYYRKPWSPTSDPEWPPAVLRYGFFQSSRLLFHHNIERWASSLIKEEQMHKGQQDSRLLPEAVVAVWQNQLKLFEHISNLNLESWLEVTDFISSFKVSCNTCAWWKKDLLLLKKISLSHTLVVASQGWSDGRKQLWGLQWCGHFW